MLNESQYSFDWNEDMLEPFEEETKTVEDTLYNLIGEAVKIIQESPELMKELNKSFKKLEDENEALKEENKKLKNEYEVLNLDYKYLDGYVDGIKYILELKEEN